jgi:Xaa-Pro dipeptidase
MKQDRIDRFREKVLENGLDGVGLMPGANMLYLSGIHAHLSERPIVLFIPVDDLPAIIIPTLEAGKAAAAGIPENRIFSWNDDDGYTGAFQRASAQLELSGYLLGVEAYHMRLLELELLQRYAPGLTTAHVDSLMTALRSVKDEDEISSVRKAVAIAEEAMEKLIPRLQIGQSEKQISSILIEELMTAGSEAIPFTPIVSAGPNGASPHAVPTKRAIQSGDFLVIDWGAVVDDYPSDITRTFAVGKANPEQRRIYETVRLANRNARAIARPGASGQDVDRAARSVIEEMDYGPYFIHRTGHGLGLEVHEPPYMMEGNEEQLRTGVVFTIEPGIYIADSGGVRIEDNILITPAGSESLTTLSRELIQVG